MQMIDLLNKCDNLYRNTPCCHDDGRYCNCHDCLEQDWYGGQDEYPCRRMHFYYILNYGPSYSSEIYNYLEHSKILENNFNSKTIKILSLGCGFSPELLAIKKYINDKQLSIRVRYTGVDKSTVWKETRMSIRGTTYIDGDILDGFSLVGFDLIFVVKLFSTLKNNSNHMQFLELLKEEIGTNLNDDSFLIFVDVNLDIKGRDIFNNTISPLFENKRHFFYKIDRAYTGTYTSIPSLNNVFDIPDNLAVSPKRTVCKTVIFEYGK
jgi:hypothetical protein